VTATFKFVSAVAGLALSGVLFGPRAAEPLGTQQCNTECQDRFTDCIDRCDGVLSCQKECDRVVTACVKACTAAPPPSGSAAPSASPSSPPKPAAQADSWAFSPDDGSSQ
jgi:hypothetical protein